MLVDHYSKWPEVQPIVTQDGDTVVEFFLRECICRHGCPLVLHVDLGTHFEGPLRRLCESWGIKLENSKREHPQGSGIVERLIQTLKKSLIKMGEGDVLYWHEKIPLALMGYRNSVHSSTGYSPYYANYARSPNLTCKYTELQQPRHFGEETTAFEEEDIARDIAHRAEVMSEVWRRMEWNLARAKERQKKDYEKRRSFANPPNWIFRVGDFVQLKPSMRDGVIGSFTKPPFNSVFVVYAMHGTLLTLLGKEKRRERMFMQWPMEQARIVHRGNGRVPEDILQACGIWSTASVSAAAATAVAAANPLSFKEGGQDGGYMSEEEEGEEAPSTGSAGAAARGAAAASAAAAAPTAAIAGAP